MDDHDLTSETQGLLSETHEGSSYQNSGSIFPTPSSPPPSLAPPPSSSSSSSSSSFSTSSPTYETSSLPSVDDVESGAFKMRSIPQAAPATSYTATGAAQAHASYGSIPTRIVDSSGGSNTNSNVEHDVVARFRERQRQAEAKAREFTREFLDTTKKTECGWVSQVLALFGVALFTAGLAYIFVSYEKIPSNVVITNVDDDFTSTTAKPHVVFILTDDLGWNSMGYMDYDLSFATPKLTSMASQGIVLDSYYAQEVCTPSRAALMTGRHPLTTGMQYSIIMPTTSWGLSVDETTMAEAFKSNGYATHMVGKWHLGHFSPRLLPTARGFDSFTGYLAGENYYWSKKNPDHPTFTDMMKATTECYYPYVEDDLHTYSTFFYRDKAIEIIDDHDSSESLFLYIAFQAVHDPFMDVKHYENGIPKEYLKDGVFDKIHDGVVGHKRRQYAMALSLLDDAVSDIYDALNAKGMLNSTYIVFASDNGGCYLAGGKNGPLRGTKGSLFEGGSKVDSFIYSPSLIAEELKGSKYQGLFHVSDWFPTLMKLTNSTFEAKEGYELDGFSHVSSWYNFSSPTISANSSSTNDEESSEITFIGDGPRSHMLYNYFYNVKDMYYDKWTNGSFAIRNNRYKLMHTYDSDEYGDWFNYEDTIGNDDSLAEGTCSQALASTGDFTYFLFDLQEDPYEEVNLYDSDEDEIVAAKEELYALLEEYEERSTMMTGDIEAKNRKTMPVWKDHGDYIMPWVKSEDLTKYSGTFPNDCSLNPTQEPTATPSTEIPTEEPTINPTESPTVPGETVEPTFEATEEPSGEPTLEPSPEPTNVPSTASPTIKPTSGNGPTWAPSTHYGPTWAPTNNGAPSSPVAPTKPTFSPPTYPTTPTAPTSEWSFPTFKPLAVPTVMPTPTTDLSTESPTDAPVVETPEPSLEPTKAGVDDDKSDDDEGDDDGDTDDEVKTDDEDSHGDDEVSSPSQAPTEADTNDDDDSAPTHKPTHKPTYSPTEKDDDSTSTTDDWDDDWDD